MRKATVAHDALALRQLTSRPHEGARPDALFSLLPLTEDRTAATGGV
jgi:hypothetical protein